MPGGRVVVVGLGPAGPELITEQARAAIVRIPTRFVRTARHPSASAVPDAVSFDGIYESGSTLDHVYRQIVEELAVAASRHGEVLSPSGASSCSVAMTE